MSGNKSLQSGVEFWGGGQRQAKLVDQHRSYFGHTAEQPPFGFASQMMHGQFIIPQRIAPVRSGPGRDEAINETGARMTDFKPAFRPYTAGSAD
jgi:hypothetical protein